MSARRQLATSGEVSAALADLDSHAQRVKADIWPASLSDLDLPGLYSWWVDSAGSEALSEGIGEELEVGQVYAGQAGATVWPSGKYSGATLRSRIGGSHINGRARNSTFRLTLASILLVPLHLVATRPRALTQDSEGALSRWIAEHLEVAVHPFAEADALADLEDRVLDELDPPLNLKGRRSNAIRSRLAQLRARIATAQPDVPDLCRRRGIPSLQDLHKRRPIAWSFTIRSQRSSAKRADG